MSSENQQPKLNPKGIYFHDGTAYIHLKEGESLKDFFIRCCQGGVFQPTRYGNGHVQTGHRARRSPGDLLLIAQTYFPDTDFIDLAEVLRSMALDGVINSGFCGGINRPVFYRNGSSYNDNVGFRNGYQNLKGSDKFSLTDVNEALGIIT